MKILAYGVQSYERPLLEKAFESGFGGRHTLRCVEWTMDADTATLAKGYEGVSTSVNGRLSDEVLEQLATGGTRFITQRSIGFNNIDLAAAQRLGLWVTRVSRYSPYSVAEFAWALVQTLNRRTHRAYLRTREFDFRLDGLMGRDLHGRTTGVIGTGKIGEVFARIAKGYGMDLLGWDLARNPACGALGMRYVALPDLLTRSDVVSLHVPLTPGTYHLIDGAALGRMRPDAILVNTGRGGLIDTSALVGALHDRRLGGVALDVYEEEEGIFFRDLSDEGITEDVLARLMTFENVIATSHQAFFTREAMGTIFRTTVHNVEDYLARRTTENTLVPR